MTGYDTVPNGNPMLMDNNMIAQAPQVPQDYQEFQAVQSFQAQQPSSQFQPLPVDQTSQTVPILGPIELRKIAAGILNGVNSVVLGKEAVVREVFCALLAGGHVLLDDIPGVGKTTLAVALSRLLGLEYSRIQFTPDVTPSDVVGFSMFRQDKGTFEYQPGAVFCNLLLADEINRTSPKTQSALLEVMEERRTTVDGTTRAVPDPFFVIATQNPLGSAGTQPLPSSQLDRFMICSSLGYPSFEAELAMTADAAAPSAQDIRKRRTDGLVPLANTAVFKAMQKAVDQVFVHQAVSEYAVQLVTATRTNPLLESGASPRASIALVRMGKAWAWLRGEDFVIPADIDEQFLPVTRHRVHLGASSRAARGNVDEILESISSSVPRPRHVR
ncbi:MAG: MoxR family ATPase [Coriobacteriales bacterium]|nr:MoxR family ATPase [Coriobacteriales bacterium]